MITIAFGVAGGLLLFVFALNALGAWEVRRSMRRIERQERRAADRIAQERRRAEVQAHNAKYDPGPVFPPALQEFGWELAFWCWRSLIPSFFVGHKRIGKR
jgi:hypothetical protein